MPVTIKIGWGYKEQTVQAESGVLLSNVLRGNGPYDLPCGGKTLCRRCRIRASGRLSPLTDIELETFSLHELQNGLRLACLTYAEGDAELFPDPADIAIMDKGVTADYSFNPLYEKYGIIADIGTTTVCMRLYGCSGLIGSTSLKNPQTAFGADIISRIEHSLAGKGAELSGTILNALTDMASKLAYAAGIDGSQIDAAVLTGNTTMLYLLSGYSPKALSRAPFDADKLFGDYTPALHLLPKLNKNASVYIPRCMSAFVGADITMALLASGLCDKPKTGIMVDIGTNAEIALWHKEKLQACSTAAGPAFEGAGLSCGVYGVDGAVDHIWLDNGSVRYSTINGKKPIGICGSGIADALSVMLESEIIDETGAFEDEDDFRISEYVHVSQKDVRKLQLSKAAVRAGMETLLQMSGITWDEVSVLYIAGGFGSYLNLNSAAHIGLIPEQMLSRTKVIGNAALSGASMLLQNKGFIEKSRILASNAQTIQLDRNPVFSELYIDWMMFN